MIIFHLKSGPRDTIVLEKVKAGVYDFDTREWKNISQDVKNLISKMLEKNPDKRITAEQVLNDKWVIY